MKPKTKDGYLGLEFAKYEGKIFAKYEAKNWLIFGRGGTRKFSKGRLVEGMCWGRGLKHKAGGGGGLLHPRFKNVPHKQYLSPSLPLND